MRVITGAARGKPLETLPGDEVVRPTAERVKEGLFSAVQFYVPGARALDLFAGSGQLGIEALSRGAQLCVFVDQSREAGEVVIRNLKYTGLFAKARVLTSDAARYIRYCKETFDLIFLDPPYRHGTVAEILPLVGDVTAPGGFVVCETEREAELADAYGALALHKRYRYGKTAIVIYRKPEEEAQ
ncbi:MAG: 16S rRNA (guanine(966)-N(2))-methyltransferase RsmD [Oscillospiraceae bacterium]|nr:16S rRNA (guanine(966)-N(2))-methyltransferase RsmD [Oscillospiraceae bacterium]